MRHVVELAFLRAFAADLGKNGAVACAAVMSIATIGLYIAYAIPIRLRLKAGDAWEPGEWNLGRYYRLIGWTAVIWVGFISILFILPTNPNGVPWHTDEFHWTSFNYAPVAVLGTLLLVGSWWMLSARKWFKGRSRRARRTSSRRSSGATARRGRPSPCPRRRLAPRTGHSSREPVRRLPRSSG